MACRHSGKMDLKAHSKKFGIVFEGPGKTIQSQKDEADINVIVRNFGVTGQLPQGVRVPTYGDFTDCVTDYRSAIEIARAAEESFLALPSDFRARLENDPQRFLEYCADPNNREEMRKLGLAVVPAQAERSEAS